MNSPVPALTPGHDGKLSPYKFDLDKAKALMKEAGVSTPVTLDLAVRIGWQPHEEAAVWIQRELEKIGFKINITRQTDATFRQLASKGDLQLSIEILAIVGERSVLPHGAAVPQHVEGHQHGVLQQPGARQDPRRELPRAQRREAPGGRPGSPEDRHRRRRLGHAVVRQLDARYAIGPGRHREALGHLRTLQRDEDSPEAPEWPFSVTSCAGFRSSSRPWWA